MIEVFPACVFLPNSMERLLFAHSPINASAAYAKLKSSPVSAFHEALTIILRKVSAQEPAVQLQGLDVLERLTQVSDLPFQQQLQLDEFITPLLRVVERPTVDSKVKGKVLGLAASWADTFSEVSDLLPGFQQLKTSLLSLGFELPGVVTKKEAIPADLMDSQMINDAEGQDPDEFISEVNETLKLFEALAKNGEAEAITSLALNLDRYQEQLEIWISLLEEGDYLNKGMDLMSKVNTALDKYRNLRMGNPSE